jgi:hypothetical protein
MQPRADSITPFDAPVPEVRMIEMSEPHCRMLSSICHRAPRWSQRGATVFDDIVDCDQSAVIVVIESTRLVKNLVEMRYAVGYGQNLVDELLILRCDNLHRRERDISKLVSHGIE